MTRIHHSSRDIDNALQTLDAADSHVDPTRLRARTDLERILATDPHAHPEAPMLDPAGRAARSRWSLRRVALAGAPSS